VLSDEQVISGHCERCDSEVTKKLTYQWFFQITAFAERLLGNLEHMDWSEDVKTGQKNWIGKSEGAIIKFEIRNSKSESLEVYTTAHDTIFGATFMVIAPEHELLQNNRDIIKNWNEVSAYIDVAKNKSEVERQADKDKTGVRLEGIVAINPLTEKEIPIFVADYVLAGYGTGAIMAVPGHDERDFEFAQKYDLEVIYLTKDEKFISYQEEIKSAKGEFVVKNSQGYDGLTFAQAREQMLVDFTMAGFASAQTNYKLRDWCVSRQRYWGPPIPMIFCADCEAKGQGYHAESMPGWWPDDNLPVELPRIEKFEDILPDGSGKSVLAKHPEFYQVDCPHCGAAARRETDVSDSFVDSAWYFLRYPFTDNNDVPFGGDFFNEKSLFKPEISEAENAKSLGVTKKWLPVTSYIGGKEHTVLHLLYARFITMAMKDLGYIDFEEPFSRFYGHGLITKDGAKMSKSKGNVVNPDESFEKYGADSVRMYLRFMGAFDQGGDWADTSMQGMYRFVSKLWKIFTAEDFAQVKAEEYAPDILHKTIKGVGEDLENLKFNTAVAKIMEFVNWYKAESEKLSAGQRKSVLTKLALILAPFMPHITEEFWEILGYSPSIHAQDWPSFDEDKARGESVVIAVQVNGRLRASLELPADSKQAEVETAAKANAIVAKYLAEASVRKVIFVENRIINFVI